VLVALSRLSAIQCVIGVRVTWSVFPYLPRSLPALRHSPKQRAVSNREGMRLYVCDPI